MDKRNTLRKVQKLMETKEKYDIMVTKIKENKVKSINSISFQVSDSNVFRTFKNHEVLDGEELNEELKYVILNYFERVSKKLQDEIDKLIEFKEES